MTPQGNLAVERLGMILISNFNTILNTSSVFTGGIFVIFVVL